LAVKVGAVAIPQADPGHDPVVTEALDEKLPLAPLEGAVKVTDTPPTGLVLTSVTDTWNWLEKAVLTGAD
jgi:hypothetical protein